MITDAISTKRLRRDLNNAIHIPKRTNRKIVGECEEWLQKADAALPRFLASFQPQERAALEAVLYTNLVSLTRYFMAITVDITRQPR